MFKGLFKDHASSQEDARSSITDAESILKQPISREQTLDDQILTLWKEVWQGLYEYRHRRGHAYVHRGGSHVDRLTKLYLAAGMSASTSHIFMSRNDSPKQLNRTSEVLGLLSLALEQQGPRQLRLFSGLSISSLESVVALLEAYKRLLPAMDEIYMTLRSLDLGFRAPTTDDEKAVEQKFQPLADTLAKQLLHLDARLDLLVLNLGDENWEKYGDSREHRGWLVHESVFPQSGKGTKGFSSISRGEN